MLHYLNPKARQHTNTGRRLGADTNPAETASKVALQAAPLEKVSGPRMWELGLEALGVEFMALGFGASSFKLRV